MMTRWATLGSENQNCFQKANICVRHQITNTFYFYLSNPTCWSLRIYSWHPTFWWGFTLSETDVRTWSMMGSLAVSLVICVFWTSRTGFSVWTEEAECCIFNLVHEEYPSTCLIITNRWVAAAQQMHPLSTKNHCCTARYLCSCNGKVSED